MVEFFVVGAKEWFGEKGELSSLFLDKEAYRELGDLQNQGVLRFQKQALVLENTALSSGPGICQRTGVGSNRLEKKKSLPEHGSESGLFPREISIEREEGSGKQ